MTELWLIEPGVVNTELPSHITHEPTREAVQKSYDIATAKPEEVAEIITFVLARPCRLAITEALLRPADQLGRGVRPLMPRSALVAWTVRSSSSPICRHILSYIVCRDRSTPWP